MFDQFKKLKQLHELQKELSTARIEVEQDGNTMLLNGKMEILEIHLTDELIASGKEAVEKTIINLHEQGLKKIQQEMAGKMGILGGLM